MRTLYIVRHAKSSWDFAELSDHDRPLNNRGRSDAPLMGEQLASRSVQPDLIISSPAVRAISTATLIAKELEYDPAKIAIEGELYGTDASTMLSVLKATPEDVEVLLLVGHNEAISDFTNLLSPEPIARIPTAGVAALTFDCDNWDEVAEENAKLLFFDFPKNYK